MLSDAVRRRLEALNRGPIDAPSVPRSTPTQAAIAPSPGPPSSAAADHRPSPALWQPASQPIDVPSPRMPAGAEECANDRGQHWRWRRTLASFCPQAAQRVGSAVDDCRQPGLTRPPSDLALLRQALPANVLFLDLETCGFAGSMIFLVGLVWQSNAELVVDQLLARTYAEEAAVLESLWQIVAERSLLVTFNGKSFDWPMVVDRSTLHHLLAAEPINGRTERMTPPASGQPATVAADLALAHCDLLHHARRRWRRQLPDCKLQTLERRICGRWRAGDLPGAQVPPAYHDFVRSGNWRAMASILHHNALDLATLVELAAALLTAGRAPAHGLPPRLAE